MRKILYILKVLVEFMIVNELYDRCSEYCMPNIMMRKKGIQKSTTNFFLNMIKRFKNGRIFDIKQKESELQEEDNEDVAKESNDLAENDICFE